MTENEKRLLENRLSAEVGRPVMVVGSTDGLGSVELAALAKDDEKRIVVIVDERPAQTIKIPISIAEDWLAPLPIPAIPRKEREWWRGGNPKHRRHA